MPTQRTKKEKGFTLIELLVVVAIIGILAAIALPKLFSAICTAKEGKAQGVISSLNTALSVYYGRNEGNFPLESSKVDVDPTTSGIDGSGGYDFAQYFASNPESPWSGGPDYKYISNGKDYTLSIESPDNGCDGTDQSGTADGSGDDCFYYNYNTGAMANSGACP